MEIRLYGPLEIRVEGEVVGLPRRQQRALVAVLALRAGEMVSTDRLIDDLWGGKPPASAVGSLQNTISAVRKALGADVVATQPPGYRLAVDPDDVDVHRFERLVKQARTTEVEDRAGLLRQALELCRGAPLADLAFEPFAASEIARLEELRLAAVEERLEADLELGRHAELIAELEGLTASYPLHERFRGQLMVALYRCGRQAEALEVYRAARLALGDELGLDPSPELQELERKVLRQDPELAPPSVVTESPSAPPAERRLVTILAGIPPAEEEPEALRRALDELLERTRAALTSHGGKLERFGPEGFVAVFGSEAPRDDDAVRAVRAAAELGVPAGVATGPVVAGAGAVVTRAARLARSGGVRLDARTFELVRDAVAVEEDGETYLVREVDPAAEGRARRLDTPLAGRQAELQQLAATLATAETGHLCRVVTVLGEPGIGKTRLALEVALRAGDRADVLVARCLPQGEGSTFLPLLAALRRANPEHALEGDPDAELVLARLATLAEGSDAAPLGESYWAVRKLLEALARPRPVLFVLDDAHWAEPALLDLVDYLADRVEMPLVVLCLSRPELERALGETLRLGPLADEDTRAIVAHEAELDEETLDRIVGQAEGNALYAEQLAVFAAEGSQGLPPTLEAVLAGRLGRLEPDERAVVQRAAVVGREFSRDAVAALSDGEVVRHLLAVTRRGLIHPAATADPGDDGYTFHHALLRDAAYQSLTRDDRAGLHERVAAWLDRDGLGDDALVGYHLEQAALLRRELGEEADELAAAAGGRLRDAGMRVWRTNDPAAASGLLGRAVGLLPAGAGRAELLWEWSLAQRTQERGDAANAALDESEREAAAAGARNIAARVAAERAFTRFSTGELSLSGAVTALSDALAVLEAAGDQRGLGRVELYLASVHAHAGNFREWGAAAARAELPYIAGGFSHAVCLLIQAEALFYGDVHVDEALTQCQELLDRAPDKLAEGSALAVLGALSALAGKAEDGLQLLGRARGLFEDIGSRRGLAATWAPLFIVGQRLAGNAELAEAEARRNIEELAALGDPGRASTRSADLAHMLLDRGDVASAEETAAFAERESLDADVVAQFLWRSAQARVHARRGDLERAELLASDAVAIASLTDCLCDRAWAHLALAEVHGLAGRRTAASRERTAARKLLKQKGAVAPLAIMDQMEGALSSSSQVPS